jgi:hypothetical protein
MGVRADPLVVAQDAEKGSISPARPQARQDALLPGPRSRVEKILNVPHRVRPAAVLRLRLCSGRGASWRAWGRAGVVGTFLSILQRGLQALFP